MHAEQQNTAWIQERSQAPEPSDECGFGQVCKKRRYQARVEPSIAGEFLRLDGRDDAVDAELSFLEGDAPGVDVRHPDPILKYIRDDVPGPPAVPAGKVQDRPAPGQGAKPPCEDLPLRRPDPVS